MQALKAANVEFIVAPFEADAQMAYLAVNDIVHSVITEDSDLLPYGCPRVGDLPFMLICSHNRASLCSAHLSKLQDVCAPRLHSEHISTCSQGKAKFGTTSWKAWRTVVDNNSAVTPCMSCIKLCAVPIQWLLGWVMDISP